MSKLSLGVAKAAVALRPEAVLEMQVQIAIPESRSELTASMNALGGAISLGGWATAAVVYAWTEPTSGGRPSESDEKSPLFNLSDFARLGIRGLAARDTVRAYRSAWERAIDRGWVEPVARGDVVRLPERDFREVEAHVGQNSGDSEWFTPKDYIEAAVRVMGAIDLDPASNAVANEVVGATTFYTLEQDGLRQPWAGRIWMNPPYKQPAVKEFCMRLADEVAEGRVDQACVLVNNATETGFFQAMAEVAAAICFPLGRISFWHPDKDSATPLQGQAILYFGELSERFREEFDAFGFTVAR